MKVAHQKKSFSFQHLGNFSTDPGRPAIKFFKAGLTFANIFPNKFENQQKVPFFPISSVSDKKSSA